MPIYQYIHPETEELKEVVQGMKDKHFYIDENGVEWKRVFSTSQICSNTTDMDPYSSKDFVRKTNDKNLTVGEMWDMSRDLSNRRKDKDGVDPIKNKHEAERSNKMAKKRRNYEKTEAKRRSKKKE